MTSLSPKKRRTTRRNMPAGTSSTSEKPSLAFSGWGDATKRQGFFASPAAASCGGNGLLRMTVGALAVALISCACGTLQAASWQELFGGVPAEKAGHQAAADASPASSRPPRGLDVAAVLEGLDSPTRAGSGLAAERLAVAGDEAASVAPVLAEESLAMQDDAGVCAADAEACRVALEQLRLDRISEIDLDIRVAGVAGNDYPCECRLEGEVFEPRQFATTTFTWKAAGYCHKPLYFEHWNFERYGHSYGWAADPFISAAHFFGTLPILPYKMGVELPWECVYPVGYYRPGDCAPWTVPAFPVSVRGMAVEAATVTGLVFLLP